MEKNHQTLNKKRSDTALMRLLHKISNRYKALATRLGLQVPQLVLEDLNGPRTSPQEDRRTLGCYRVQYGAEEVVLDLELLFHAPRWMVWYVALHEFGHHAHRHGWGKDTSARRGTRWIMLGDQEHVAYRCSVSESAADRFAREFSDGAGLSQRELKQLSWLSGAWTSQNDLPALQVKGWQPHRHSSSWQVGGWEPDQGAADPRWAVAA